MCCPKKLWMFHPWKCSRAGCLGASATWSSERCLSPQQSCWNWLIFKAPLNPSMTLWLWDTDLKMLYTQSAHPKSTEGLQKASNQWWRTGEIPQMRYKWVHIYLHRFFLPCVLKQIFRNNGMKISIITEWFPWKLLWFWRLTDPGKSSLYFTWAFKLDWRLYLRKQ